LPFNKLDLSFLLADYNWFSQLLID